MAVEGVWDPPGDPGLGGGGFLAGGDFWARARIYKSQKNVRKCPAVYRGAEIPSHFDKPRYGNQPKNTFIKSTPRPEMQGPVARFVLGGGFGPF
jgi:hypothetical protein